MRIARVLTRLNLGGPARQVLASDPLLALRGHEVRIFAGTPEPGEGDLLEAARAGGLDVVRVPGLRRGISPARDLLVRRRLRALLRSFRPDVLHTHASKAGALGRGAARALPEVATVHTFHGHVLEGYFPEPVSRALVAQERRMARVTDRIVAVSHATAEDLVRLGVVDEAKLVVVPPGIELQPLLALPRDPAGRRPDAEPGSLRALVSAAPEDLLVGVVGRLAEVKRPELALAAFELVARRHPRLHLVFVGDGDGRRALERELTRLPDDLVPRTHLLGAVEDMVPVWRDLDAGLLSSRSEGLPVSLIEAAAAGLPVVATPVGGVPELVAHERTGYLGETVEELAYGIDALARDADLRHAMGQRARLRAQRHHRPDVLADRLEALYRAVCEERQCAS